MHRKSVIRRQKRELAVPIWERALQVSLVRQNTEPAVPAQVSWRRQKVIPWRNPFNWGCDGCRSGPARLLVLHIRQLSGASAVAWALTEARVLSEQSLMLQRLTVPGRSWMLRESLGEPDGCGRSMCQHSVHPKPEKPKWEPRITGLVERACKLVLQSIWR